MYIYSIAVRMRVRCALRRVAGGDGWRPAAQRPTRPGVCSFRKGLFSTFPPRLSRCSTSQARVAAITRHAALQAVGFAFVAGGGYAIYTNKVRIRRYPPTCFPQFVSCACRAKRSHALFRNCIILLYTFPKLYYITLHYITLYRSV